METSYSIHTFECRYFGLLSPLNMQFARPNVDLHFWFRFFVLKCAFLFFFFFWRLFICKWLKYQNQSVPFFHDDRGHTCEFICIFFFGINTKSICNSNRQQQQNVFRYKLQYKIKKEHHKCVQVPYWPPTPTKSEHKSPLRQN